MVLIKLNIIENTFLVQEHVNFQNMYTSTDNIAGIPHSKNGGTSAGMIYTESICIDGEITFHGKNKGLG